MKNLINFNFLKSNNNLASAIFNLLQILNVKVTYSTIKDILLSNPNYPSLLAISESLNEWKVDSEAYNITTEQLQMVPVPFIAHLKSDSGSFVAVKKITPDQVVYLQENGSESKISLNDFTKQWSHSILIAESSADSGQSDYTVKRRHELLTFLKLPLFALFLFVAGVTGLSASFAHLKGPNLILPIIYFVCIIAGVLITSILLWFEYDKGNKALKKICSLGKSTNCEAVLNSKAAKILGFSWSELGFFYFIGGLLYLIVGSYSDGALNPLIFLSIAAAPFVVFSIYYQAFVVKQWCILCLSIQVLLLTQFLTALLAHKISVGLFHGWDFISVNHLLLAYILPVFVWTIFKPCLYDAKEGEDTKYNYRQFKNNIDVFNSLLIRQIPIKNNPEGLGIILGNPNAENALIKVCNPYCGPCAKSFPDLEELLNLRPEQWKVQLIYTASPTNDDYRALPVAHFLQINDKDSDRTIKALSTWYNMKKKDYEEYSKQYPIEVDFDFQKEKLAAMNNWCYNENIQFTPTYYVNGRRLPETYSIEDLKNIF